ncbi:MAG: MerC domain-containing protein [Ferruginibacter sp.]|nr:MerC domain-containing protein [Cytophagales bacterium]
MKKISAFPKSDWIGLLSSAGCLVHCLALPTLFFLFQAATDAPESPAVHRLDYAFAGIAVVSVGYSLRGFTALTVRVLLVTALLLFVSGILLEERFQYAVFLLHAGSLGLITGHALNLRYRHARRQSLPRDKMEPSFG